jgi:hypothetical protein
LDVLTAAREFGLVTKSNLILGMGETIDEVHTALSDLHRAGCDIVTITQYLRPSPRHHPVERWVRPEEFVDLAGYAEGLGFAGVLAGRFEAYACGTGLFGKARKLKGICRELGVPVAQAVYVGDELRDLHAARQAGMRCYTVAWGFTDPAALRAAGPDAVPATTTELGALLSALLGGPALLLEVESHRPQELELALWTALPDEHHEGHGCSRPTHFEGVSFQENPWFSAAARDGWLSGVSGPVPLWWPTVSGTFAADGSAMVELRMEALVEAAPLSLLIGEDLCDIVECRVCPGGKDCFPLVASAVAVPKVDEESVGDCY